MIACSLNCRDKALISTLYESGCRISELGLVKFKDVTSYSKLEKQKTRFHIEYLSKDNHLKLYYPDFIVRLKDGSIWIVETKGREDPDVQFKDSRTERWAEDASKLTKTKWKYIKIQENLFYATNATTFIDLVKHQLEANKRRIER